MIDFLKRHADVLACEEVSQQAASLMLTKHAVRVAGTLLSSIEAPVSSE